MNPRRAAAEALLAIERGGYSNLVLKDILPELKGREERAFCSALVYTTLEHQYFLDAVIKCYAKSGVKPAARIVLRMGICQLLIMGMADHAAADQSVKLIKELGKPALSGFVNGVMRSVIREKAKHTLPEGKDPQSLSVRYSTPLWIVERFCARYGEEIAEGILSYNPQGLSIRLREGAELNGTPGRFCPNVLRVTDDSLGDVASHPLFEKGLITVQSEASALVAKVADPKAGEAVLDTCAAPGGKTAAMGNLMGEGAITAWDIHPHRVELIEKTCERMGVKVKAEAHDAAEFLPEYEEKFDLVLIDAPCSGLGVSGKPDLRLNKKESDIDELSALQKRILSVCSRYVKPGGRLVYSTCTISYAENEQVVEGFLNENPDFTPDDITPYLPEDFDKARAANGRVQLLPPVDGIEGFFIARMVRR